MTQSILFYQPPQSTIANSLVTSFIGFMEARLGVSFNSYGEFEDYASQRYELFWSTFLEWSGLRYEGDTSPICTSSRCEEALFFPNVRLNYAENLLAGIGSDATALIARREKQRTARITGGELKLRVERIAQQFRALGVDSGDRVVAVARNNAEVIICALAAASIGAIFASCSAEMPAQAVLARVSQLDPKVLIANTAARRGDLGTPLPQKIAELVVGLPSLDLFVPLDSDDGAVPLPPSLLQRRYGDLIANACEEEFEWRRFPFNHPLFAVFSSGTTGPPKCIVHGAGGTLIEHCKEHRLHCNLKPGDVLFYQTTCAWMMWNWQVSALASGVSVVVYDGPVLGAKTVWELVADEGVTTYGTSAAFLQISENEGYEPAISCDLSRLRNLISTGSVLYDHQFDWVARYVKSLPLQSVSGGTDIIGLLVLCSPNLPVYRGEIQCRSLALDVRALQRATDSGGLGELVCGNPFPSRPIGFWLDPEGERFKAAYFSQNPGYWTHGDLIKFTSTRGARIYGRSDGILNIGGVRIGPAEIYGPLGDIPEIVAALAVGREDSRVPGGARLVLLVVLKEGCQLDARLVARIRSVLFRKGSATMVPSWVIDVPDLPRTHNGKLSETAARDVVNARSAVNALTLANPESLSEIRQRVAQHFNRVDGRPH